MMYLETINQDGQHLSEILTPNALKVLIQLPRPILNNFSMEQLLCGKGLLNVEVSREQLDKAKEKIREMLAEYDCKKLEINPLLQQNASFFKQFGYCLKEVPGRRKGAVYELTKEETAK